MTGIWRLDDYNPYDNAVYDEKHRRKTFMDSVHRIGVEPRKAHKKRLEIMRREGKI